MAMCYCHKIDNDYLSTFLLYELYFINHEYFHNIPVDLIYLLHIDYKWQAGMG
jgi:hypothetical protein